MRWGAGVRRVAGGGSDLRGQSYCACTARRTSVATAVCGPTISRTSVCRKDWVEIRLSHQWWAIPKSNLTVSVKSQIIQYMHRFKSFNQMSNPILPDISNLLATNLKSNLKSFLFSTWHVSFTHFYNSRNRVNLYSTVQYSTVQYSTVQAVTVNH